MKSTTQAKPNKRPDRPDCIEPRVNFLRKYFWARKTRWFTVTETPGDEPTPHFSKEEIPMETWVLGGSETPAPHSETPAHRHVSRGTWGTSRGSRWSPGSCGSPVWKPSTPWVPALLKPQVIYYARHFQKQFWNALFQNQNNLCKKFLFLSQPVEMSKLYPCTLLQSKSYFIHSPRKKTSSP